MALPDPPAPDDSLEWVLQRLEWTRAHGIWPNGLRYLWTDAFGVVLLVSLCEQLGEERYLAEADELVANVDEVLGRSRGYRIGEEPDRDGQYFHYLAMWLFALWRFGRHRPAALEKAVDIVRQIHDPFVVPGVGVHWKMAEDLTGPYLGYGLGALDAFDGYVSYRLINDTLGGDPLAREIGQMRDLIDRQWGGLRVDQDLGLGMLLWLAHWFRDDPGEPWADVLTRSSLETLDSMWQPDLRVGEDGGKGGYVARFPYEPQVRFAFTNYGVSLGLQAAGTPPPWDGRLPGLHRYFDRYRSGDEYDTNAITHVMGCCAHLPGLLLRQPGDR